MKVYILVTCIGVLEYWYSNKDHAEDHLAYFLSNMDEESWGHIVELKQDEIYDY